MVMADHMIPYAEAAMARQERALDDATRALARRTEELETFKDQVMTLKERLQGYVQRSEHVPRNFIIDERVRMGGIIWCYARYGVSSAA